ncbi:hypothetical protein [Candidatus Phytoplasma oryzae]|nr:hypothetical protein PIE28_01105 [Candidatus Phytoplasma oryzae]
MIFNLKKKFLFYFFIFTNFVFFIFFKKYIYAGNIISNNIDLSSSLSNYQHIEYYNFNQNIRKSLIQFNDKGKVKYFIQYYLNGTKKFYFEYFENEIDHKISKRIEYLLNGSKFCEKNYDRETSKIIEEIYYNNNKIISLTKFDRKTGKIKEYKIYNEKEEITYQYSG